MKVFALLILGALVGAAGYLFGTESGRQRKDDLLKKAHKGADTAKDAASDAADAVTDTAGDLADKAADIADTAADTAKDAVDQLKS
jgi:gas vesicle protein